MNTVPESRPIFTHELPPSDPRGRQNFTVECIGRPAIGGARNSYLVGLHVFPFTAPAFGHGNYAMKIAFQNGNPAVAGHNGITMEILAAVVIDRLEGLQEGMYPCEENAKALEHFKQGLEWLHDRSRRLQQMYLDRDV